MVPTLRRPMDSENTSKYLGEMEEPQLYQELD